MIDRFVDRPQMRQFVHQRFKAVAPRMPSDENHALIMQRHPAYAAAECMLNHGFAHDVNFPAGLASGPPTPGSRFPAQVA